MNKAKEGRFNEFASDVRAELHRDKVARMLTNFFYRGISLKTIRGIGPALLLAAVK
jgi:hypothetical protein